LKRLSASSAAPTPLGAAHGGHLALAGGSGAVAQLEGPREPARLPGPARYEQVVEAARGMVREDPKRVAQLVKTWVGENG